MSVVENTTNVGHSTQTSELTNGKAIDQPITLAVIGCGQRGDVSSLTMEIYGRYKIYDTARPTLSTRWMNQANVKS